MESAIQTVVKVYLSSAKGKDSLGGNDFKNLVKKNLGNIMDDTNNSAAIKEMRQGVDEDNDGKVSFTEYLSLIGYLANSVSQRRSEENAPKAS